MELEGLEPNGRTGQGDVSIPTVQLKFSNGKMVQDFASRDIRQVDPFLIVTSFTCVDYLIRSIFKSREQVLVVGSKIGSYLLYVSHIRHADDTVTFSSDRLVSTVAFGHVFRGKAT